LIPGQEPSSAFDEGYGDPFNHNQSAQALPLMSHAAPFQRGEAFEEYDDTKSFRSDDFDQRTRLTSAADDASNYGSESYAPSRNMFQNADRKAPLDKEVLPGEVQEGETSEVIKETSARRRWVALCWALTFWVPNPFLNWFGRMKREDVRQAWREKLALNLIIWFVCGCTVFVIAVLGNIICPTEHVFSTGELASHSYKRDPNNVYTAVRGEVFDLTELASLHQRIVPVVPLKSVMNYGGQIADNLFPVQVIIITTINHLVGIDFPSRSAHSVMVSPDPSALT
jgi:chitin synthase